MNTPPPYTPAFSLELEVIPPGQRKRALGRVSLRIEGCICIDDCPVLEIGGRLRVHFPRGVDIKQTARGKRLTRAINAEVRRRWNAAHAGRAADAC